MKNLYFTIFILLFLTGCNKDEDTILEVNPEILNFTSNGGSFSLNISTNAEWKASVTMGDWITITPASGTKNGVINLVAMENIRRG